MNQRRARGRIRTRISGAAPPAAERFLVEYYDAGNQVDWGATWKDTSWMGIPVRKLPSDLWLYQELLFKIRPDVVIECGTAFGGSALYFAHLFDLLDHGRVITIDIDEWDLEIPGYSGRPSHPRVTYLLGSSTDDEMVARVRSQLSPTDKVMVVLDSDHHFGHVLHEMEAYAPLVSVGSLLVVEDTMLNGHPVHPLFGDGPMEAVAAFLAHHDDFERQPWEEKFLASFNPGGYLQRIR